MNLITFDTPTSSNHTSYCTRIMAEYFYGDLSSPTLPSKKGKRGLNVVLKGEEFPEVKQTEPSELPGFYKLGAVPYPSLCHDKKNYTRMPEDNIKRVTEKFEICNVEKEDLTLPGQIIDNMAECQLCNIAGIRVTIFSSFINPATNDTTTMSQITFKLQDEALRSHQQKQKSYSVIITSLVKDENDPITSFSQSESFKIDDKDGQHAFLIALASQEELLYFKSKSLTIMYEVTVSSVPFDTEA